MMGRLKKGGNHIPLNNKLVKEPEGNEENRYPDSDSNKTKRIYTKEPYKAHNNTLKEEILQVINENFIEMILDMVNQNIQETLKTFQDNKNKDCEKAQEQIKESIEALYKHQSETENTINREINEFRMKIHNIKEEVPHDMENLRKKNKTEMQKKKWNATPAD
jgi:membrane-associated HD superfamily phosphohydrolase